MSTPTSGRSQSLAMRVEPSLPPRQAAIENGVYMAVDEGAYFQATGQLLPMQTWEKALLDDEIGEVQP